MEISYALVFGLGAMIGGFAVVVIVAFCVSAAEAGRRAADAIVEAQFGADETAGE